MSSNDRWGQKPHDDKDEPIHCYQTDDGNALVIADDRRPFGWIEAEIDDIAILEDWQ